MRSDTNINRAIGEILRASLPARLRNEVGTEDVKEWVCEHLEAYTEEKTRFPKQSLLPWTNMIAYDDWDEDTFFVILILREDAIEWFCGMGYWPDIRKFAEGEAEDVPAANLHREWSARFTVPCPPLTLGKEVVKKWLGRTW